MLLKSLEFFDYKTHSHFQISARNRNVLVGPNNVGKSASLDALRISFDVLRFAKRRTAVLKSQGLDGVCSTYFVPPSVVQIDLRYCVHNFETDVPARIHLTAANGSKFKINMQLDGDLECYVVSDARPQKGAKFLGEQFPINIVVVPTLSPLEQNEELVLLETVERNRYGRLASRNFRNYWLHQPDEVFDRFAELVEQGWPGLRVFKPVIEHANGKATVRMYFRETANRSPEVQWAGFGFQVWMQIMTHVMRAAAGDIIVLDEPDVYLHPDLQRKLMKIISGMSEQYFVATHSSEIINSVEPGDVLIMRPGARSAKRIRTDDDYSIAFDLIGSSENAQFARLAKNRKVLYFEGLDRSLLLRLAQLVGADDYLNDTSITFMKTDGFSNWQRVSASAWVLNEFFEFKVRVACLFDRDFRCDDAVTEFVAGLRESEVLCFVLPFKELENSLINRKAIKKVILKYSLKELPSDWERKFDETFDGIIAATRDHVASRRIGARIQYELQKNPKRDVAGISAEEMRAFSLSWDQEPLRLKMIEGKEVYRALKRTVGELYSVSLSEPRIVAEMRADDMDEGLKGIILKMRDFFVEQ
ncbi:ATP-binding protein [Peteryoungia desertarenae]|uniref:ATP-binding protein n=1 Tax=Peteryoungia desertarenae TaxID=1813451 RepID=A0ABX6QS63_9HYPH|nr:AAA family ATPase [Peteryoungia desertarenae]QLF71027.1 ATP-binding protein [Peteryoungia desertarenae]